MLPIHHTRTLFKSDLLQVIDYCCSGQDGHAPQEEYAARPEIILPRSGAYLARSAAGEFLVDPNQALFFNQGQAYQVTHPLPGGDRSTVFLLRPDVLVELTPARMRTASPSERPFARNHAILDTRLRLAQYWLLTYTRIEQSDALQVEESLLQLLGELLSNLEEREGKTKSTAPARAGRDAQDLAERVKLVLGDRFRESLQLGEIARAVYASPFHLCRSFKRATGLPIHRYLTRLRLNQALEDLLDQPGAPLSRIALDLGFASHNHFTSTFRAEFGLTPSEFRQAVIGKRASLEARQMRNFLKA